jgi:hypothetical protein
MTGSQDLQESLRKEEFFPQRRKGAKKFLLETRQRFAPLREKFFC